MKNPSRSTIQLLLIAIICALVLIATTNLMAPVMRFILATDRGTPLQLMGCIIAAVLGLRIIYLLLNMVGNYYAGQLDTIQKEKTSMQGGEQP